MISSDNGSIFFELVIGFSFTDQMQVTGLAIYLHVTFVSKPIVVGESLIAPPPLIIDIPKEPFFRLYKPEGYAGVQTPCRH